MELTGKTVWITGASSGIGAALAEAFGKAGARIILSGRREAALADVARRLENEWFVLPFEATDYAALPGIVDRAWAWRGAIDILVNNAGISQRSMALDTDFDVYRQIMEVDFFAPLRLTQFVLPKMVARGQGHVIQIASVAGKIGAPMRTGYCAAKHALVGFSDALRAEVAQHGIGVTVVTPGFVQTNIAENALDGHGKRFGPKEDPVGQGISAAEAADEILAGLRAGKPEVPVGRGLEMQALWLKRLSPRYVFRRVAKMAPKR
ncbi:SDR family oxidoreductase [Sphingosinicella microcystinivorans]|uniref:Oxidoreductase n=1 Tax=Sphingosinicella microcystinivorans TaxID=335406 RepID=A0AAD1G2T0_SPHMI|nr:SDR family oxidoreductase [Sphingosinicella microcystinivorans]RKS88170.1 short-subunit dehydrogenase [Sphingosinicella microcystinivorans]BBE35981.1 oxidoreductase [Sphingosinicella microcystinivorans]